MNRTVRDGFRLLFNPSYVLLLAHVFEAVFGAAFAAEDFRNPSFDYHLNSTQGTFVLTDDINNQARHNDDSISQQLVLRNFLTGAWEVNTSTGALGSPARCSNSFDAGTTYVVIPTPTVTLDPWQTLSPAEWQRNVLAKSSTSVLKCTCNTDQTGTTTCSGINTGQPWNGTLGPATITESAMCADSGYYYDNSRVICADQIPDGVSATVNPGNAKEGVTFNGMFTANDPDVLQFQDSLTWDIKPKPVGFAISPTGGATATLSFTPDAQSQT